MSLLGRHVFRKHFALFASVIFAFAVMERSCEMLEVGLRKDDSFLVDDDFGLCSSILLSFCFSFGHKAVFLYNS